MPEPLFSRRYVCGICLSGPWLLRGRPQTVEPESDARQAGGGVSREAIFGRDEILAHILSREPASYLVVGGRQLGKTSLLQAIRRRLEDDPKVDVHFLALTGSDLTAALARSLGLSRDAGLDAVLGRLAESDRRTLFLIDEADVLVRRDHQRLGEGEGDVFGRLRSLSEEGRCHFILTGFWNLYEVAVLDYGSPLRNFGETLRLDALERQACVQLATEPMATLGLGYQQGAVWITWPRRPTSSAPEGTRRPGKLGRNKETSRCGCI